MTKDILFLIISILCLIIVLILTINEAIQTFHAYYPSGANPGRIRGESGACGPDYVVLGGMRYNVEWIIKGEEGIIYNEERDKKEIPG